jgi:uncharacterized membrane protein
MLKPRTAMLDAFPRLLMREPVMRTAHREGTEGRVGTGRIEAFSDGVFAVAITILILEIALPELPSGRVIPNLPGLVFGLWPEFVSFVISFLVIGLFWVVHHRIFRLIIRADFTLLWLNLLLLMCIVFLPFPTELIAEHGQNQFSIVFYAVCMTVTGLVLAALWFYAVTGYRLVSADVDPALVRHFSAHAVLLPLAFLASIGFSFLLGPVAAKIFWVLIVVAYFVSPWVHD